MGVYYCYFQISVLNVSVISDTVTIANPHNQKLFENFSNFFQCKEVLRPKL